MANKAYMRFLRDALDHCNLNDDEQLGAEAFLDFLADWRPGPDAVPEPDVYGYGDAFGTYAYGYCDEDSLRVYGIDPAALDDVDGLLGRWTEEINDSIGCTDLIPDALDAAVRDLGIGSETVVPEETETVGRDAAAPTR